MIKKDKVEDAEVLVTPNLYTLYIEELCNHKYTGNAANFIKKHKLDILDYPWLLTN